MVHGGGLLPPIFCQQENQKKVRGKPEAAQRTACGLHGGLSEQSERWRCTAGAAHTPPGLQTRTDLRRMLTDLHWNL